jgi:uncharacterized GH25 family protein
VAAHAHRQWLLPSTTVLSGGSQWVTVDAAVSNDLFYFEHVPMRLDNLVVTGPDGAAVQPENASTGKYRSTFDVPLTQPGTYRIAVVNQGLFASWKENGQTKRWRGAADALAANVPANAQELQVTEMASRVESYVTNGKPSKQALTTTGRGLELAPITHPNDLAAGETASFRLLLDGKPPPTRRFRGAGRRPLSRSSQRVRHDHRRRRQVQREVAGCRHVLDGSRTARPEDIGQARHGSPRHLRGDGGSAAAVRRPLRYRR